MRKKWIAAIIIYFALIAACLVVIYAVPSVKGMLEKTYITEYGKLDITDEVSAYIVRDETVYVAAHDCEINRLADPDKLVKAKTRVVELTPIISEEEEALKEAGPDADAETAEAAAQANDGGENNISRKYIRVIEDLGGDVVSTESGYSKEAGYISYFVDGVESKLSTDNLDSLSKEDYESLTDLRALETPESKCGKGDPIFKVTRNSKWYLVFYLDKKAGEKYYEGRTVYVDIAGKNIPVKVARVEIGKKTAKITLSCKMFFEGFLQERSLKTTVTVASAEGLMLQDSSIVKKADQPGVFVKNKLGEHKFKPISVKADDGERCVVYSDIYVDEGGNYVETLKTYDEIVAEPTDEEIAALQEQAAAEAAEKAEKEAAEKAAAEKEAAEKAAAEKAAALRAAEEEAAAQAAETAESEESSESDSEEPAEDGTSDEASGEEGSDED